MCTCFLACARASTIAACKPSCKVRQAGDRERLPNSRLAVCMMYMNMHMYMYVYMHMYMHMYVHHFRVEHQPSPTLSPTDPVGQSWPRASSGPQGQCMYVCISNKCVATHYIIRAIVRDQ